MGAALLPSLVALDLVVAAGPPAGGLAAAVGLLAAGLLAAGLLDARESKYLLRTSSCSTY